MSGWIKLHRAIKDHWVYSDPKKLKWWLDILLEANYKPTKVLLKGRLIECDRGQSVNSLETWAKRWNTTKKTVSTFLKLLESDKMITTENVTVTTRLTICNYESYQDEVNAEETHTTTQSKRTVDDEYTHSTPKQERKKEKKEKNNIFNFRKELINLGVEEQVVSDWLKVREKKKAANTETAFKRIKTEINKAQLSPNDCITMAVEKSWQGFSAEWLKNTQQKKVRHDSDFD